MGLDLERPGVIGSIEENADKSGKGSLWRACLGFQRSCPNKNLGNAVLSLAHKYCTHQNQLPILKQLEGICNTHLDSSKEEFHEAVQALKNAIEMAPKKKSKVDERQELWLRLDRLIK